MNVPGLNDPGLDFGGIAGRRIMVVEDELLVSMLIEETLTDHGCTVVGPYTTVAEALAAASHVIADGALLDVNLRGEKVYPVAEVLDGRGIPFLLLSGYGSDAIPAGRGQWRACSKPFRPEALMAALAEHIERSG